MIEHGVFRVTLDSWDRGKAATLSVRVQTMGEDLFLHLEVWEPAGGPLMFEQLVRIEQGMRMVSARLSEAARFDGQRLGYRPGAPPPHPARIPDGLVQHLLDELGALKKERGVWQPKWKAGDVVVLDRAGSPDLSVVDVDTQTAERVEKRQVQINNSRCTCPMRKLLMVGCPRARGGDSCFSVGEA